MRCQKVRSCLSAYCREELTGRQRLSVQEHLADCEACRRQEESVRVFHLKAVEVRPPALSADFNTKLLNRIAQERFVETRTKAYLPKRAPLFMWRRVVPVLATVTMAVLSIISIMSGPTGFFAPGNVGSTISAGLTEPYLGGQPTNNPNMASKLRKDWTLQSQFEQTARINRISGLLTSRNGFSLDERGNLELIGSFGSNRLPYSVHVYRLRPVVRVYEQVDSQPAQGANSIY